MHRSPMIQKVHDELQNVSIKKVMFLIESVNLTPRERDIVIKTELEGFSITDIQDIYNIAFTTVVKTKKKAMLKIYKYISQDNNDTLSL
jgi:DNA-directed RNA polymerase specialized sigma24 family protein